MLLTAMSTFKVFSGSIDSVHYDTSQQRLLPSRLASVSCYLRETSHPITNVRNSRYFNGHARPTRTFSHRYPCWHGSAVMSALSPQKVWPIMGQFNWPLTESVSFSSPSSSVFSLSSVFILTSGPYFRGHYMLQPGGHGASMIPKVVALLC
jgi:hypothetical protein